MNYEKAKLSLRLYDREITVEWPNQDLTLSELFETFTGMLVTQTFYLENIHEFIKDWARDLETLQNTKTSENAI